MNMNNEKTKEERKIHNRQAVMRAVKKGGFYEIKGNIIHLGDKAFVANSVIQWLVDKLHDNSFSEGSINFYIDAVNKYILGEVNLRWSGEDLIIEGA